MNRATLPTAARPWSGVDDSRLWWLVFLGLLAWQAWLTLSLFASGPNFGDNTDGAVADLATRACAAWQRLIDDEPIISGRHPVHLYFGFLGAQSFRERGTLCCYDPAFQAGYPKTPVFDAGSRPAELFLYLTGGAYRPAAYKIGIAVACLLVPLFLAIAARSFGLGRGSSCLAVALGLLICWGTPGRAAVEAGDVDQLVGGVAAMSYASLLLAWHGTPHPGNWLLLVLVGCFGWFAHPFLWLLLVSLLLVYYVSVGARHQLGWHVALLAATAVPLAANSFWLPDWLRYWWIRLPLQLGTFTLKHRTFQTIWDCPLWGDAGDRMVGLSVLGLAVIGVAVLNQTRQRVAARLVGLGAGGLFAMTLIGLAWEPLGQLGAVQLLTTALWFAVLPAVHVLVEALRLATQRSGSPWRVALVASLLATMTAAVIPWSLGPWLTRWARLPPLGLGLSPQRRTMVELLRTRTTPDSRILWEDWPASAVAPRWSVLLPILTERAYIGGLAPDGCIEHAHAGLMDQALLGRPIATWSDDELEGYCRRYNVGWVVARSPAVVKRFTDWKGTAAATRLDDEAPGFLFDVGQHSLVLKGQARVLCVSRERIALADVVPDGDEVVLSLHYQAGLQASPARIQIEREPDPFDPIPLLRLKVPAPTPLITLTWDDRR